MCRFRDYYFVRKSNCIYRIFGDFHLKERYLVLLRYWFDGTKWIKPPKYGAEYNLKEVLDLYNVELRFIDYYNIYLGVIGLNEIEEYYDPVHFMMESSDPGIIRIKNCLDHCAVTETDFGIVGSSLVGIYKSTSDIDLVLYGFPSCDQAESFIMNFDNKSAYNKLPESVMVNKFCSLTDSKITHFKRRNIYSRIFYDKKLDFHYTYSTNFVRLSTLEKSKQISKIENYHGIVFSTEKRHLYPGVIKIRLKTDDTPQVFDVQFLDHSLHFLLPGDEIKFKGIKCISSNNKTGRYSLIAKELLFFKDFTNSQLLL